MGLLQLGVQTVGDEHVAGGVGDHEGGAAGLGDGLGGDAAAPEDGDFAGADVHGFAPVGLVDIRDADGGGVAGVDGRNRLAVGGPTDYNRCSG